MKRLIVLLVLLAACQDNEADRPELRTKAAQEVGSTSAVLEAELVETGPIKPLTVGFLWGTTTDLSIFSAPSRHIFGDTSGKGPFSIKVENFTASTTYYYRAFAADTGFTKIYYGTVVSFTTLP
ncbi:MAG: hypothetical protein JNN04_08455 [Cyclobacteriaceae bacterium]|nr:hypothetical protein [Cyclobacteriaceae bacterium]